MKNFFRSNSEPVHWAHLEERGIYFGLRLMVWTYRVLGRGFFSVLLMPVMVYFFLTARSARQASQDFLAGVYETPEGAQALKRRPGWRASFRHFYEFGQSVLDKVAAWVGDIEVDDIVFENEAVLDAVVREGRGLVLIGSHLGNMEVCRALSNRNGAPPLNVLVHTKHSENFSKLMREINPGAIVSLIQTTEVGLDTAIILQGAINRGEIVVIVGDRTPESLSGRHSWARFLGRDAPFPQGPYILASLFKCPVQLIFCIKKRNRYHIAFEPFADRIELPRARRNAALQLYISRFAERLEFHAVRAPFQWFNFFDFWAQAGRVRAQAEKGENELGASPG